MLKVNQETEVTFVKPDLLNSYDIVLYKYLCIQVNEFNLKEFLSGWQDNRVRILMFDTRKQPCLRYLAAAFSFREHAVAGYCNTAR